MVFPVPPNSADFPDLVWGKRGESHGQADGVGTQPGEPVHHDVYAEPTGTGYLL